MIVKNIELVAYRNYGHQKVEFHPKVNILLGPNGQGKTNLLEALYILCRGQSFRPGKNETLIFHKESPEKSLPSSQISAKIQSGGLNWDVKVSIDERRRSVTVNGKKASASKLTQNYPCILFSPESLAAIKEGPEHRRQLIDEIMISHRPQNADLLADFRRCLKSRNRVLRDAKQGLIEENQAQDLLESLNGSYLPLVTQVTMARLGALGAIQEDLFLAFKKVFNRENVDLSVDYLISDQSALDWDQKQVENASQKRLSELHRAELASGVTLVGPHKHEIRFLMDENDSRFYCSQGQQRAIILSLKLAQIMYHYRAQNEHPVLLLDDVLSELDQERRTSLIEFLKGISSQIFVTTTDLSFPTRFGEAEMAVFEVENGALTKENTCQTRS